MRLQGDALESQHPVPGQPNILRLLPRKLTRDLNVANRDRAPGLNHQLHLGSDSCTADVHLLLGVRTLRAHVCSTLLRVAIRGRGQHPELHKIHIGHRVEHNLHPIHLVTLRVLSVREPHAHEHQPLLRRVLHACVHRRVPQGGAVRQRAMGLDGEAPVGGDAAVDVELAEGEVRLSDVGLLDDDHVRCMSSAYTLDIILHPILRFHNRTLRPRRRRPHLLVVIPRVHQHLHIMSHGQLHPGGGVFPVQVDHHIVSSGWQAGALVAVGHHGDVIRCELHVSHFVRWTGYRGEHLAAQATGEPQVVSRPPLSDQPRGLHRWSPLDRPSEVPAIQMTPSRRVVVEGQPQGAEQRARRNGTRG
mmetsp:Transcript_9428/g.23920  ORF Transcript_9428/g.23920 Transcript_9428/m.23920 type:complete len:360 (-) Transcript_9428:3632-4711(-)